MKNHKKYNQDVFVQVLETIPVPDHNVLSQAFKIDNTNLKVATGIVSKFLNSSLDEIKWDKNSLHFVANRIKTSTKNSVNLINSSFCPTWNDQVEDYLKAFNILIGGSEGKYHGLSITKEIYIPRLTEYQITKGFTDCLFLDDVECRYERVLSLIEALPVSENLMKSLQELKNKNKPSLSVESEKVISGKRRIDIFIQWVTSEKRCRIAIEAKFDHHVTVKQLPSYKKYCASKSTQDVQEVEYDLILLTNNGGAEKRNHSWKGLSWFNLMKRLESNLAKRNCDSSSFQSFRTFVWKKIGGY